MGKSKSFQRPCPRCGQKHFAGTPCANLSAGSATPRKSRRVTRDDGQPRSQRAAPKYTIRPVRAKRSPTKPSRAVGPAAITEENKQAILARLGRSRRSPPAKKQEGKGKKPAKKAKRETITCRECLQTKPLSAFPNPRRRRCEDCGGQPQARSVRTVSGGAPGLGRRR